MEDDVRRNNINDQYQNTATISNNLVPQVKMQMINDFDDREPYRFEEEEK